MKIRTLKRHFINFCDGFQIKLNLRRRQWGSWSCQANFRCENYLFYMKICLKFVLKVLFLQFNPIGINTWRKFGAYLASQPLSPSPNFSIFGSNRCPARLRWKTPPYQTITVATLNWRGPSPPSQNCSELEKKESAVTNLPPASDQLLSFASQNCWFREGCQEAPCDNLSQYPASSQWDSTGV